MKKLLLFILIAAFAANGLMAQKFFTRDGNVSFYSDAPLEKIEAHNNSATSVMDTESGRLEFAVLIKGFQFEKALMQEHFNENYMESSKYPKAVFKGRITNPEAIDFGKDGTYTVRVSGDITIHGVTQPLETTATIVVKDGLFSAEAKFPLTVADFKIEIPGVVREKIAKTVVVTVKCDYQPFNR